MRRTHGDQLGKGGQDIEDLRVKAGIIGVVGLPGRNVLEEIPKAEMRAQGLRGIHQRDVGIQETRNEPRVMWVRELSEGPQ